MSYLLDTNVISELRKKSRINKNVWAWFQAVDEAHLYTSVLVLGEIRKGAERVATKDPVHAKALREWLHVIERSFQNRILPVDFDVAQQWGCMNARKDYPVIDSLLAATALSRDLTLVTRNTVDLRGCGAKLLNPFDV